MSKVERNAETLTAEADGQGGNDLEMLGERRELLNYSDTC